ncbi:CMRF35-like molecule 7 [Alligator sinensis]|uniref:CMRF35-like molecule 7 n=1 Tax=Alligator sinensis TaxID=38654 RepID=A0A3Q0G5K8_ALLSI|nr:CMRF35-like molecule 7 [Alligator sinensis]
MWTSPVSVWFLFVGCWAVRGPGTVHGPEGGSVSVPCHYKEGYEEYPKFWCRRKIMLCILSQILETNGTEAKMHWGRVSILDNHIQHMFTVTLESLTQADTGIYLCGVARTGLPHPRDSVEVIVSPAPPSNAAVKMTKSTEQPEASAFTWTVTDEDASRPSASSPMDDNGKSIQDQEQQTHIYILAVIFLPALFLLGLISAAICVAVRARRRSTSTVHSRPAQNLPLSQPLN